MQNNFFNSEFYPTPDKVIEMMTTGLDLAGKTILEPSAGSGKIVDYVKQLGAKVIACELNSDLQKIAGSKCRILKPDFFDVKAEEISHIDFIIMNPPFSNADKHIKHAFEIAPEGCQIIALCNVETIKNRYSVRRTELGEIIDKHGHWQNIGDVFSKADRKTDVDVALIQMFKPKTGDSEFDGYFFDMNDEQEAVVNGSGIMRHNKIREIVNRYIGAVKMFDGVMAASGEINRLIGPISSGLGISFGAHTSGNHNTIQTVTRDIFKKELQKSAWRSVFNEMNMAKYVTGKVMADINKFVEQQQAVPFTMPNIYRMIEMIVGTHAGRMDRVLSETFDYICSLSADNSTAGEKWKTNSNYKINRRFIMGWITEIGWSGELSIRYNSREKLEDIVKALCFITGENYDDQHDLMSWFNSPYKIKCDGNVLNGYQNQSTRPDDWSFRNKIETLEKNGHKVEVIKVDRTFGQWIEWGFFRVRGYKKGTMHFEFLDEKVWERFNRRVAEIKGWQLPTKTNNKRKGTERTRKSGVEKFSQSLF
jgi:hypothetical protein